MKKNIISEKLKGFEIKFSTKPGVFSEHGLDEGSKLLIDHMAITDETILADLGCGSGVIGFVHLKPKGETTWVVQTQIKPVVERLFEKYFGNCKIVAAGKRHVIIKAQKG
ncbi:methyltransferase [Candidatus Daviesbacteria bacterium]|nr:methyltransferase [Candidatus Daviesbacteria bacterium]